MNKCYWSFISHLNTSNKIFFFIATGNYQSYKESLPEFEDISRYYTLRQPKGTSPGFQPNEVQTPSIDKGQPWRFRERVMSKMKGVPIVTLLPGICRCL